jgi:hypothetical protein
MAPTALDLFGVDIPRYMLGAPLFGDRKGTSKLATDKIPGREVARAAAGTGEARS